MSRGRLSYHKWAISDMGAGWFIAERIIDKNLQHHEIKAHCLACAKTDILAEYGGKVDLRGWHRQGLCGAFLLAMARTVDEEVEDNGT